MQDQLLRVQQEQQRLQTEQQHSTRDSRICLMQWYILSVNTTVVAVISELLYVNYACQQSEAKIWDANGKCSEPRPVGPRWILQLQTWGKVSEQ